jgi:hypothetical protein
MKMHRDVIKTGAVTIILIMLSSLAVADDSSFVTRLFNWLRSNIPIFNLKEQGAESGEQRAKSEEQRAKGGREGEAPAERSAKSKVPRAGREESHALSPKLYALCSTRTVKLLRFYNYPNPFIPDLGTDFICELDGEATLELKIFGMNGSLVEKLNWNSSESPPHWDGKDTIGRTVRTGMYIYFLKVTDAITGEVADLRYGKMMAWYMD